MLIVNSPKQNSTGREIIQNVHQMCQKLARRLNLYDKNTLSHLCNTENSAKRVPHVLPEENELGRLNIYLSLQ